MVITDYRKDERLQWLRFVLNPQTERPTVCDWPALFDFTDKQALIGICLPTQCPDCLDNDLLQEWIGTCLLLENQNKLLNQRIVQLFGMMDKAGFRCCLLKGQGNATMYPNVLLRYPGDIDVWVDTDEETAYQYVKNKFPEEKATYKHIHFPIFEDAPVDIHVTPLKFYSSMYQKKLQHWIEQNKEEQFKNLKRLPEATRDVCIPTNKFNAVYQLGHMMIHMFDEGIGLRQVVDYFYVLKNLKVSQKEREELAETIKSLGMMRFARAMMWIESEVLGLPQKRCVVELDDRQGRRLLDDILEGGDFGHYSQRYHGRNGFYYKGLVEAWRDIRFLPIAPREGSARLFRKMGVAIRHAVNQIK